MIRKYKNFDIATYSKVHRIRLSEKLIKTLERNDVERPKALQKKTLVLSNLNNTLETLPVVKDAIDNELIKRENKAIRD